MFGCCCLSPSSSFFHVIPAARFCLTLVTATLLLSKKCIYLYCCIFYNISCIRLEISLSLSHFFALPFPLFWSFYPELCSLSLDLTPVLLQLKGWAWLLLLPVPVIQYRWCIDFQSHGPLKHRAAHTASGGMAVHWVGWPIWLLPESPDWQS